MNRSEQPWKVKVRVTDKRTPADWSSQQLLAELRSALDGHTAQTDTESARLDYGRAQRTGAPEIIYAANKSPDQVAELAGRLLERNGSVLVSRASDDAINAIAQVHGSHILDQPAGADMIRIRLQDYEPESSYGHVAVFTAGTSDVPRAEEVRLVAEEMGTSTRIWSDIGVAGLHRLIQPFREAIDWNTSVIVVVAGMDGALPSVISGLSPVPVIGLPVSVGYGYGGGGEGALMAMLQTCAPGLTVVNIDNSVGAGIAAARIARQSISDQV